MIAAAVVSALAAMVWAAPNTPDNAAWNVNTVASKDPVTFQGSWPNHAYMKSPDDWRKQTFYQFVTDRFADGNPNNNEGKFGGYNVGDKSYRHGGDFLGIIDKLDYIKSLGYTAIWVSPVFQNMENSYHGYAQIDFTVLDDRFGTVDDFRKMTDAAHARGMYVIVDIVVNHMANLYYFEGHETSAAPFRLHNGEYRLFPRGNVTYVDFPVDNTFYNDGSYGTVYGSDGYPVTDAGGGSFWFSDLHHNGDLQDYGDVWQNHNGKIYGIMDDLRTDHVRVQKKIIAMTQSLIASVDIDGIRMDTPMQVPLDFFQNWGPAVRSFAASLGKDNFLIFGEFYCSRERAATMTGRGRTPNQYGQESFISNDLYAFDGGIHYPFFFWTQQAIRQQNNNPSGIKRDVWDHDIPAYDFYNPRRGENRYRHLNFFDNHDQERMAQSPNGYAKTQMAAAVISFWPGIPLFYYGDEQGFCTVGTALDGWSREDMMTSIAWNSLPTCSPDGINPASKGDHFNMTNPYFLHVQKINNIRRQYLYAQVCDTIYERWIQTGNSNGIYAYSRVCGSDPNGWLLSVFNTWNEPLQAGGQLGDFFTGWATGDVIVNLLNPSETYTLSANGKFDGNGLWVGGLEYKLFVRKQGFKALDPVVVSVYPPHDAVFSAYPPPDLAIKVTFSEDMDASSVLSAFSLDGQTISSDFLSYDAPSRTLTCKMLSDNPLLQRDGVHYIALSESATSTAGHKLFGAFRSRFLTGDTRYNILLNPSATNDASMIAVMDGPAGLVKLTHKANGAGWFRVKNEASQPPARGEDTQWSAWRPYTNETSVHQWQLAPLLGHGARYVTAQYWADHSAAYFVHSSLSF